MKPILQIFVYEPALRGRQQCRPKIQTFFSWYQIIHGPRCRSCTARFQAGEFSMIAVILGFAMGVIDSVHRQVILMADGEGFRGAWLI
ncbi:MAG: hypothetical protein JST16_10880 [Bdellovibrionales bacterium]|nr:hypothetical protein [Bdellovibrionales bacterium]